MDSMNKPRPFDNFGNETPEEVRIKDSGHLLMKLGNRLEDLESENRRAWAKAWSKGLPPPPMPEEHAKVLAEFNRVSDSHPE